MTNRVLVKQIAIRKRLLNLLLLCLSPGNKFIIYLSQNLDMLVAKKQNLIYTNHKKRVLSSNFKYKQIESFKKIA